MEYEQSRYSELAIASLILGFLSLISPLVIASLINTITVISCTLLCSFQFLISIGAIISGHVGLQKIKKAPNQIRGRSLAITGLILGYIMSVIFVVGLIVFIIFIIFIVWVFSQPWGG
jgi:hypothetical protein